jgi:hypothetical protein
MTGFHDRAVRRHFLMLYLRSHLVLPVCVGILIVVGLATLWSWQMAPDNPNPIDREIVQRNLITAISVIAAASVALTLRSPWAEMDDAGGHIVSRIRLATLLIVTVLLVAAMAALGMMWESSGAGRMLARGFLGYLGIALVARQLLGDGRGWWPGFAWAGLAIVAGASWRVHYPPWAWSMQGAGDTAAWIIALIACVVGVGILAQSPIYAQNHR